MNLDPYDRETAWQVFDLFSRAEAAKRDYLKANDESVKRKRTWKKLEDEARKLIAVRSKNRDKPTLFDPVVNEVAEPTAFDDFRKRIGIGRSPGDIAAFCDEVERCAQNEFVAVLQLTPSVEAALKRKDCNCSTVLGLLDWEPAIFDRGHPVNLLDPASPKEIRESAYEIVRAVRAWIESIEEDIWENLRLREMVE